MSSEFRELLRKVGSGKHTSKGLTRSEATTALQMMVDGVATPAQIGAFLISHRIKRPTGTELAGMLDFYDSRSQKLQPICPNKTVFVLGIPYDGRSRTAPISPITSLILKTAGIPVVMHGGDRLPTKYGLPLIEIWKALGINFETLAFDNYQAFFEKEEFALCYTPTFLPDSTKLTSYREELGKRPPIATLELAWSPYAGDNSHTIAGYVHPPTEGIIHSTFGERQHSPYTLIKGLEGSGDLRISQITIVATHERDEAGNIKYLKPNPYEYDLGGHDVHLESPENYSERLQALINGEKNDLFNTAIWNGAFYLWHCGAVEDLKTGIATSEAFVLEGKLKDTLAQLQSSLSQY
ncbi:anthranilate phosphoribosyltransferase [[Leptolyngbya] sp. PCC 7376]|uniref:anthranilate phosphoribosyltransferase family protein n=1 Tax=[Leptolyngbya] sp. PCC 7376 TaxID=111781 RepID=UPI00029EF4E1|nr:anthranilate phosphoribosyltransferase family protein [[Leptolyngbya] sp. PCC 7376]AFY40460.1 anthranilate phosphoribosyltransferase [[Leptolyngbya] sp. PCC 7376]